MKGKNEIIAYLQEHQECYDRFAFDANMRYLLSKGFDHEGAKNLILAYCQVSDQTFEQRICNAYYLRISVNSGVSGDLKQELLEKKNETLNANLRNDNRLN